MYIIIYLLPIKYIDTNNIIYKYIYIRINRTINLNREDWKNPEIERGWSGTQCASWVQWRSMLAAARRRSGSLSVVHLASSLNPPHPPNTTLQRIQCCNKWHLRHISALVCQRYFLRIITMFYQQNGLISQRWNMYFKYVF